MKEIIRPNIAWICILYIIATVPPALESKKTPILAPILNRIRTQFLDPSYTEPQ